MFGSAAAYFGLEQLPGAQNILSPKNIRSAEVGLRYTNTESSLGGVDHEKGIAARIAAGSDRGRGRIFPQAPWRGQRSAWRCPGATARSGSTPMPGMAGGEKLSPLAAYYFGSFRNNYVDDRAGQTLPRAGSMPGFEIDEIAARRFAKLTGEINLPPLRFAEAGVPAFYLGYIRPAAFASVMAVAAPDGKSHHYESVGAQFDLNFTVALRLPMVFSLGAAAGFADGHYRKTEWLASLKIM